MQWITSKENRILLRCLANLLVAKILAKSAKPGLEPGRITSDEKTDLFGVMPVNFSSP